MNEIQFFNNSNFGNLPLIVVDGIEMFGATEAAKALSFSNPYDAIKNHIEEDDLAVHEVIDSIGRQQRKNFINESGLYSLIFGASKQGNNKEIQENARRFKRWVTSEVLPAIRKSGTYQVKMSIEDMMIVQLQDMKSIKSDVDMLKDSMRISGTQQFHIQDEGKRQVLNCIGGVDSAAYPKMNRKVFAQLWRDFKRYFKLPRYSELPKKDYERGLEFIKAWQPDTATRLEIEELNNQGKLDIAYEY